MSAKGPKSKDNPQSTASSSHRKKKLSEEVEQIVEQDSLSGQNNSTNNSETDNDAVTLSQDQSQHQSQAGSDLALTTKTSKANKIGLWLGTGVGVAALIVAVYYGFWNYRMQKWQAGKEYHDWCAEFKATMNSTPAQCDSTLRAEPIPPPLIKRQGDHADYTKYSFPVGWRPLRWPPSPTNIPTEPDHPFGLAPPAPRQPTLAPTLPYYVSWGLTTIITSITTFFFTVILTTLVVQVVQLDPARGGRGGYLRASVIRKNRTLHARWTSQLVLLLQRRFWAIFRGRRTYYSTSILYHITSGFTVQLAVAWFSSEVNLIAMSLSSAAVIWFARRFQFRMTPRYIGEWTKKEPEEFDVRTKTAWRMFRHEAQQPVIEDQGRKIRWLTRRAIDHIDRERRQKMIPPY